jgi:hypothetical protein
MAMNQEFLVYKTCYHPLLEVKCYSTGFNPDHSMGM